MVTNESTRLLTKVNFVRGANYQDTILLQSPVKFSLFAEENKKTFAWLTDNLSGIVWEAGIYHQTFISNVSNALEHRFPNSTIFTKVIKK